MPTANEITIQCMGDISLDGLFCDPQHHQALSENMAEVAASLGPCDLRVGNWESPLWGDGGMNLLKRPRVSTTRQAATCLMPLGFDVALLGNNHVYDCLEKGFENTVALLESNGIQWLGAGRTAEEARRPLVIERKGLKIGLLNYTGPETHPNIPEEAGIVLNILECDRAVSETSALAEEVDVVLVFLHWGDEELVRFPMVKQRVMARGMVEAGATVVVGGHAHCLHGDEAWKHGHVFYGMGNFLFGRLSASPGKTGYDWPVLSRRTGVACCRVGKGIVAEASWRFFLQNGLVLDEDDTPSRQRRQRRISAPLARSDRRLAKQYKREKLLQHLILPGLRFIKRSGGLIGALAGIRKRHFALLMRLLRRR